MERGDKMIVHINNAIMRAEMARNRLTNDKLKIITGISKATISAVKNGKTCSISTATKIAKALNLDVMELIESEV